MAPLRDPVKNIVYYAEAEDVDTVIVNGKTVVSDSRVLGADMGELSRKLQTAATKMWPRLSKHDWAHRAVDEMSPQTFAYWSE